MPSNSLLEIFVKFVDHFDANQKKIKSLKDLFEEILKATIFLSFFFILHQIL